MRLFSDNSRTNRTITEAIQLNGEKINRYTNEFWTSKQRQSSSIHEISYRACFKAQLPRFFIDLLSKADDTIYDPFTGRGTTVIEAGLLGRNIISNDINPLSEILAKPRFFIPSLNRVEGRLNGIGKSDNLKADIDLSMFYHPKTESEIVSLKNYLSEKKEKDDIDRWIQMVATNRLTGHSSGFFSVYTLPPNQAVTQENQKKINEKRNQRPEYRDTHKLILRKTKSLLRNLSVEKIRNLRNVGLSATFLRNDARQTPEIPNESVQLTVTSPPFLDIVDYAQDNWLRCWFNSIDVETVSKNITAQKKIEQWTKVMEEAFNEFYRITKIGGFVAFEVGEVRNGKIKLDEYVVPIGLKAGFECLGIIVNLQEFTKTSNIWGIKNNKKGTNTNRIVLFAK